MLRFIFFLALAFAFLDAGAGVAAADDKVWAALYFAENAKPPPGVKVAGEELRHRLHEVFGYRHYELMGGQVIDLRHPWAHWVMPRRDFFMRVEPLRRGNEDDPWRIDYEIYKDGFIVAKGRYEPHEETPLFINGPDFREGRFIYVVETRD